MAPARPRRQDPPMSNSFKFFPCFPRTCVAPGVSRMPYCSGGWSDRHRLSPNMTYACLQEMKVTHGPGRHPQISRPHRSAVTRAPVAPARLRHLESERGSVRSDPFGVCPVRRASTAVFVAADLLSRVLEALALSQLGKRNSTSMSTARGNIRA